MDSVIRPLLLSLTLFVYTDLHSQSEPQFTQYMHNRYLFNPAYAGSEDALEISALHRSQYVSLANKFIATQALNINLPLYAISSGVGVTGVNDFIGYLRTTYVSLNYDYRKNFKWGKFGIGIGAGIIQTSLDGAQLRAPEGSYTSEVNHHDDYLPSNLQSGIAPDLSFGLYFNGNKYFAGAALNHIVLSSASVTAPAGKTRLDFSRNLFFMGGYEFNVSRKLSIMPSVFIKSDLHKVQVDIAGTFTIIDNILAGISLRGYSKNMIDALALMIGFRYKGFQLVYSYDASLSYLTRFNTGSHEISLRYRYSFKKKESRGYLYHNPRFN